MKPRFFMAQFAFLLVSLFLLTASENAPKPPSKPPQKADEKEAGVTNKEIQPPQDKNVEPKKEDEDEEKTQSYYDEKARIAVSQIDPKKIFGATDLTNILHQSALDGIGISSRMGPCGGNLSCAWANSLTRREFLNRVNQIYGPDTARALDIGWSNGVSDTARKLRANPNWVEVSPWSAPDGAIWLSEAGVGNYLRHGHIGYKSGNMIINNSSSKAMITANYSVSSWMKRYGRATAFVPRLPATIYRPSSS